MKHLSEGQKEIVQHAIDKITDILRGGVEDFPVDELHHRLFNQDYFVIGNRDAEQFLVRCGGIFTAINDVKHYELLNFGRVSTDLSWPESVANMLAYIEGEQFLAQCPTFLKAAWRLSKEDLQAIIEELNSL